MNWTKFKTQVLFSLNVAIVVTLILWRISGSFYYSFIPLAWFALGLLFKGLRGVEKKFFITLGKINGTIILSLFYFLIFSPFSLIYRQFFRHESFKSRNSGLSAKAKISSFNTPF